MSRGQTQCGASTHSTPRRRRPEALADNPRIDAVSLEDNNPQKCSICGTELAAGGWFCRVPREKTRIVLRSPPCALSYFDTLHPTTNSDEQDLADYDHRLHFIVDGEKPCD